MSEVHASALAEAMRAARRDAGLTQEKVAAASHVSVQMVRRLEAGSANPTLGTLVAICDTLGTTVADLLKRAGI